ncbi:unnamed protein product, partial [Polarella glacialis]
GVEYESGSGGTTEYVKALPLSSTNHTNFPGVVQMSTPQKSPDSLTSSLVPETPTTAGSARSGVSSDKLQEKARLQARLQEFAKAAVSGFSVELIDEETGSVTETLLHMDRYLNTMKIHPHGSHERSYEMKDMTSLFRGPEFVQQVPGLAHLSQRCMAVDFSNSTDYRLCFYFQEAEQLDKFYSCMKVLRMSVDKSRKKPEPGV